ncbi:hypothetical protein POTOM_045684 [Populus tomentosa]|uniref:Uncharacterized protein n=1 Tax=Populus tomentosa TaxID=118781 RepID=A0A8X7YU24_POPTO|nr:hypothetical protein POTOM_045684 [Populus tomentosa]
MSYLLLSKSTLRKKREVIFVPDQKTRFFFCQCLIETLGKRRYLRENPQELLHFEADLPTIGCRFVSGPFLILKIVLDAYRLMDMFSLHTGQMTIMSAKHSMCERYGWRFEASRKYRGVETCNYKLPYTYEIKSSIKYHIDLGTKGYCRLIYSGDHDMEAPFLGTEAWIRSLNYSIVDDWQPWHFQGQVAGYTRTFSSQIDICDCEGWRAHCSRVQACRMFCHVCKVDNSRTFVTRLRPKALSWEMVTGHCICQAPFL